MRAVVVDRGLHLSLRTDMLLDLARRSHRLVSLVVVPVLLGLLLAHPVQGVVLALVAVLAWAAVRWRQLGRTMRDGLGVGQRIEVGHRGEGEAAVVITDASGEVALGRGSALVITRFRGIVTFYGRQLSFVLPAGLLTDTEIAFLEGSAATPQGGAAPDEPPSRLPLSLTITEQAQERTGAALSRAIGMSADTLLPVVVALLFLGFGVVLRAAPMFVCGGVFAAVSLLTAPRAVLRARSAVRSAYPVGGTIHADVRADSLTTEFATVTHAVRWEAYDARRVTEHAVLLRRKGPFMSPDVYVAFPRRLFDDAAIGQLAAAVPRSF